MYCDACKEVDHARTALTRRLRCTRAWWRRKSALARGRALKRRRVSCSAASSWSAASLPRCCPFAHRSLRVPIDTGFGITLGNPGRPMLVATAVLRRVGPAVDDPVSRGAPATAATLNHGWVWALAPARCCGCAAWLHRRRRRLWSADRAPCPVGRDRRCARTPFSSRPHPRFAVALLSAGASGLALAARCYARDHRLSRGLPPVGIVNGGGILASFIAAVDDRSRARSGVGCASCRSSPGRRSSFGVLGSLMLRTDIKGKLVHWSNGARRCRIHAAVRAAARAEPRPRWLHLVATAVSYKSSLLPSPPATADLIRRAHRTDGRPLPSRPSLSARSRAGARPHAGAAAPAGGVLAGSSAVACVRPGAGVYPRNSVGSAFAVGCQAFRRGMAPAQPMLRAADSAARGGVLSVARCVLGARSALLTPSPRRVTALIPPSGSPHGSRDRGRLVRPRPAWH